MSFFANLQFKKILKTTLLFTSFFLILLSLLGFGKNFGLNINKNINKINTINVQAQTTSLNQDQNYEYFRVKVIEVIDEKEEVGLFGKTLEQNLKGRLLNGQQKGQEIEFRYSVINYKKTNFKIQVGDQLIVNQGFAGEDLVYNVVSFYRLPQILITSLIFIVFALLVVGISGLRSLLGLFINIGVIGLILIPLVLQGYNAFWLTLLCAVFLCLINTYLVHGVSVKTHISLTSILLSLIFVAILAPITTFFLDLFGVASEEALYLQIWQDSQLDLRDLFLSGILIGSLGVLDDVVIAQVTTVYELYKTDSTLGWRRLFAKGLVIGRDHIISMINTLALAYLSVSLPVIIALLIIQNQPWWVFISSDVVTEEIARTIISSFGLILAIPICNFIASYYFSNSKKNLDLFNFRQQDGQKKKLIYEDDFDLNQ